MKNDVELILRPKKPGPYRKPTPLQRAGSMPPPEEYDAAMRQVWSDIPGASRRDGHPTPYPVTLASRLIRMSSYIEDIALDRSSGPPPRHLPRSRRTAAAGITVLAARILRLGFENRDGDRRIFAAFQYFSSISKPIPHGGAALSYRLLDTFRATFEGKRYIHRDSSLGDFVAMELYENLPRRRVCSAPDFSQIAQSPSDDIRRHQPIPNSSNQF